ncbi:MAG TPA: hypothetical protein VN936_08045, partial [Candidatus Acidoferrum sp.]|nr:hypothetical protein [Candidatus Acidoferrum sp.]
MTLQDVAYRRALTAASRRMDGPFGLPGGSNHPEGGYRRCVVRNMLAAMERFAGIAGMILIACAAMFARSYALSSQPIQIEACRIHNNHGAVAPFGAVSLTFTNQGSIAASEVRFRIEYAGQTADVTDSGSFAPNAVIRHSFEAFRNLRYRGAIPESCSVAGVTLIDG